MENVTPNYCRVAKKSVRQKIHLSVPVGKTEVPELRSKTVFRRNLRARVHFFKAFYKRSEQRLPS